MKKIIGVLLACLLGGYFTAGAQYYYYDNRHYDRNLVIGAGAGTGIMNALTDLGGKTGRGKRFIKDLNPEFSRACFSLFASAHYKDAIGLRLQFSSGMITAADSILKKERAGTYGRYERNLSFRSRIQEWLLVLEFHPLFFRNYFLQDREPPRLSPYLVAGLGYFHFNPEASLAGQWYALQPLHTEGQGFTAFPERKPYALHQWNISTGSGLQYEINNWLKTGLECLYRFLHTDYLDDASLDSYISPGLFAQQLPAPLAALARQLADRRAEVDPGHLTRQDYQRGNPRNRDAYFTLQLRFIFLPGRMHR